jgi:hypothetical protein
VADSLLSGVPDSNTTLAMVCIAVDPLLLFLDRAGQHLIIETVPVNLRRVRWRCRFHDSPVRDVWSPEIVGGYPTTRNLQTHPDSAGRPDRKRSAVAYPRLYDAPSQSLDRLLSANYSGSLWR